MFLLSFTFSMCCYPHKCDPQFLSSLLSYDLEMGIMWNFSVELSPHSSSRVSSPLSSFLAPFSKPKRWLWPCPKVRLREALAVGPWDQHWHILSVIQGAFSYRNKGNCKYLTGSKRLICGFSGVFLPMWIHTVWYVGLDFPNNLKKMAACLQKKGCEPESVS